MWIDVSTDGGVTWPANRQLQMPGIPSNLPIQSDAVVMARDDGRIYVACLATDLNQGNLGGVFITWTDDNGVTWQDPSVQVYPTKNALDDKDWFAVDNNPTSPFYHRVYMMYAPSADHIVEQHSTDGGFTWSGRQTISASNTEYTYPVVASDGTAYNFMMNNWGAGRTGTIQMTKSTNGGVTWSSPSTVTTAQQPGSPIRGADSFRFFSILSAAVDPADLAPNGQDLYVAWTDNRNFAANGTDVMYVKSSNSGATWSAPIRLSHDPTGVVRDHITPMLSVGADSRVHAFWLDRRLDPNNRFFDSWYSSSTDGGATWDADTRVSMLSQDLNVGFPPGSGNAAGDYWGLDVSGNTVYVAWNDTRAGNQNILVSRGTLNGGPTPTPTTLVATSTRTATSIPSSTTIPTSTNPPSTSTSVASATQINTIIPSTTATSGGGSATATRTVAPSATWTMPTTTPTGTRTIVPPTSTGTPPAETATSTATVAVTQTPCTSTWQAVTAPATGNFVSVSALSKDNVWAVGVGNNIYHWDGSTWTNTPYPIPAGTGGSLVAVSAWVANDVWAAGSYSDIGGNGFPLVEHWNGSAWSIVGIFGQGKSAPTGGSLNNLKDITAVGPGEAWSVGGSSIGESDLTRYCDLTNGCVAYAQASFASELLGVSGISPSDVWAVGYTRGYALITHWDGAAWSSNILSPLIGPIDDVEMIAHNDVWAASDAGLIHWDGIAWTTVPASGGAKSLSAIASNDVWAAGSTLQHWNGSAWVVDPYTPGSPLASISASSTHDVWAVGANSLVLHYTDQVYADVPPDNTFYTHINYLTCLGIMSGYTCGSEGEPCDQNNSPYFRPNSSIIRGQLAKIVSNAAGYTEDPGTQVYEDVLPSNVFYPFIQRLTNHQVITGYPCGTISEEPCISPDNRPYFRTYANATRGQISKIVANAAGVQDPVPADQQTYTDVPIDSAFWVYIERLTARGVMSGYACGRPGEPCDDQNRPYFRPGSSATRGQTSKIVANTFFAGCCTAAKP